MHWRMYLIALSGCLQSYFNVFFVFFLLPANRAFHVQPAGPKIMAFPHLFVSLYVSLCVPLIKCEIITLIRCCHATLLRLTESGNAKSKQLLVMPTGSLTNREWLPGELLSGLQCQRPDWFLDIKYLKPVWF